MWKVAALAEAAHLQVVPHTWTNGIGLLANLHLAAAIPNCSHFEFPHDPGSGWTAAAGNDDYTVMEISGHGVDAEDMRVIMCRPGDPLFRFLSRVPLTRPG